MAIVHARINNVFFGSKQPKMGAVISVDSFFDHPFLNHKVSYNNGYELKESKQLLEKFFKARR
tara:strand:- start:492 stop:680 length:189 start_codon:yes stop_codon:yes gene_type:complete